MKYSQITGVAACLLLIGVCFMPWSFVAAKNIAISGMQATGTDFGRPGKMNIFFAVVMMVLFLLKSIGAKRVNVFVTALNLAWSIRNYLLVTSCLMGDCPEKKAGIYLLLFLSSVILLMSFFPKIDIPRRAD